ncbi:MAG: subclass B1 metallo-beta-lactamase [Bacteroidales bacterium]|nr:MAG: subclass B1 metallo-beta-lactamase [Bacteroidales bacterium]
MKRIDPLSFLLVVLIITSIRHAYTQPEISNIIKISDDLELSKISDNSYIHISYLVTLRGQRVACNGLIYINGNEAFIIDTPVNDEVTLELINWLKSNLNVGIAGLIATHWHVDCMGGLGQVHKCGIKSYAHELTCEIAESKNLPVPEVSFKDSLVINSGEKEIICKYFGAGHTIDNIVVWIPEEKILFGGCMIKSLSATRPGNIRNADLDSWPGTMEKAITRFKNARIVVPGHGSYGGPELLTYTLNLIMQYTGNN